jgi:hypothetical protein
MKPVTLAELGKRYFAEAAAFEASNIDTDEGLDALAEETWMATERRMIGVPVQSDDDALAAVDWLIHSSNGCMICFEEDEIEGSVIRELRAYLARKVLS